MANDSGGALFSRRICIGVDGAVFSAASRSRFAFIVFAFELTRDYGAVLPLMLVGVIADSIGLVLLKNSIMTEKLARRGLRIHSDYEADAFQHVQVSSVMNSDVPNGGVSIHVPAGRMVTHKLTGAFGNLYNHCPMTLHSLLFPCRS